MNDGFTIHTLPQQTETKVTRENGVFSIRYAYTRSQETKEQGEIGQDYLVFAHHDNSCVFALCDGVSMSFYGDIAARLLGNSLIQWLTLNHMKNQKTENELVQELSGYLTNLVNGSMNIVNEHEIPSSVIPLVREVLEEKRKLGSDSMYLCGRVDLPSDQFPEGRLFLAWQGDSRVRIWNEVQDVTPTSKIYPDTAQRWSTNKGMVNGMPNIFIASLENSLSKVTAYSDGFSSLDKYEAIPSSDLTLQQLLDEESRKPTSDDISFLEITF